MFDSEKNKVKKRKMLYFVLKFQTNKRQGFMSVTQSTEKQNGKKQINVQKYFET